ncbi:MAG: S8 family serine peptidase [Geodermatophilaceae bacterium]
MTTPIWRRTLAVLAAAVVATTLGAGVAGAEDEPQVTVEGTDSANAIADQYIVVMRPGARAAANRVAAVLEARNNGGQIRSEYAAALQGFAATLSPRALDLLRRNPNVASIEADQTISLSATQSPATWGLDRVDQRALPLSNSYTYNFTGSGVTAYVIDTGIRFSHTEFGGRAVSGYDAIDGGSADDCNGHGTHVAGTVGGTTYGVAKAVRVVGVRVLNCQGSGSNSQVIAGIDWATSNHTSGQPAVANMSLGGGVSTALDTAVRNSIADGITYALAAGNDNANACNGSPSRVAEALTVGSTTNTDARSSFSNYGTCLDIFAPGSSITSAWYTSNTATNTISGTSMATPHVAGAAALFLQQNPSAAPQAVRDGLVNSATTGVVTNPGTGSPNRLLYTLGGAAPPPPPPPPGCGGLPEQFTGSLSGTGDQDYYTSSGGFTAVAGTHRGCLDGPTGVDFDLALYRWNGFGWSRVAIAQSTGPDESITYNGTAGTYRWRVYSYSGSGSYAFGMQRP